MCVRARAQVRVCERESRRMQRGDSSPATWVSAAGTTDENVEIYSINEKCPLYYDECLIEGAYIHAETKVKRHKGKLFVHVATLATLTQK